MEYLCCICGVGKVDKVKLDEHIRREHSDKQIVSCKVCDKEFEGKKKLSNHMRNHKEASFKNCEVCHKAVKAGSYFGHIKLCAPSDSEELKCNTCEYKWIILN